MLSELKDQLMIGWSNDISVQELIEILNTPISLINVESTITNFEKFHPPQKQNPASTFIDFMNIFQPPRLFQPPHFTLILTTLHYTDHIKFMK